jgi:hypothetical protein
VVVLVEDAAQSWASAYVETTDLRWIGDRLWQWLEWSGVDDALVRSVRVVEPFVFAECVE